MLCLIIGGYWDIFDGNIMMRYPFFDIYNFYPFDYVCKYNGIMYIYIFKINQALDLGIHETMFIGLYIII